jgi:AAA domain
VSRSEIWRKPQIDDPYYAKYLRGDGYDADAMDALGARPNGQDETVSLHGFNPADWEGKKAPSRRWDVPDYIAHGIVALLYADGGTGKGYLGLQLAVARAVSKDWIGLPVEPGRTLVLSTEDDLDEMWRRIEGMLPFYGVSMKDLADLSTSSVKIPCLACLRKASSSQRRCITRWMRSSPILSLAWLSSMCSRTCSPARKTIGRKSLNSSACSSVFAASTIAPFSYPRSLALLA